MILSFASIDTLFRYRVMVCKEYRKCTGDRHLHMRSAFTKIFLCFIFGALIQSKCFCLLINIKVKVLNIIENNKIIQYFNFNTCSRTLKQRGWSPGFSETKKPGSDMRHAGSNWFFFTEIRSLKNYISPFPKKNCQKINHFMYFIYLGPRFGTQ